MLLHNGVSAGHAITGQEHLSSGQRQGYVALGGPNERYQQPNVLKPLFITFNSLAYLAYIITILVFVMSQKAVD